MPPDRLLQLSWLSPWVGQDPLMAIPSIDPSCVFGALYTLCHFATWFQVFTMDGGTCDFLHHIIVNSILNLPGLSERNSSCAIIYVICHMSYVICLSLHCQFTNLKYLKSPKGGSPPPPPPNLQSISLPTKLNKLPSQARGL